MMSEWLREYLTYLEVEQGYAQNTLCCYARILEDFLRFVGRRSPKLRRLSRDELRRYVLELRDQRGNCARSIRLKLQSIRSFLLYLHEKGAGPRLGLFAKGEFRYKMEQREAQSLSQSQLELLLNTLAKAVQEAHKACEQKKSRTVQLRKRFFAAQRDLCLFTLLAGTGLRISEALGIRLADIDPVDKSIRITGKGKKIRRVFFDLEGIERCLEHYLSSRSQLNLPHDYLFVSTKEFRPLQARGVQKLLKDRLRTANLSTSTSPHTLRHSFATLAIERGANIKAVSQILGHANCSITVDLYTRTSPLRTCGRSCSFAAL
jgi:site-specific recombinase XerD